MPKVLVILPEGFEEIEAVAPIDLMCRAGAEVTIAAHGPSTHVTGRCNMTLHADTTFGQAADAPYDLIFVPGGPGVLNLRGDLKLRAYLQHQASAGRWIAAICAAPSVLGDAGLLDGRRFTGHHSIAKEFPRLLPDQRVVVDGNIITSRGAGTAFDFGLMLVEKLYSAEKAREIAAATCA